MNILDFFDRERFGRTKSEEWRLIISQAVRLELWDAALDHAVWLSTLRQSSAEQHDCVCAPRIKTPTEALNRHYVGAEGETAVAIFLGEPWPRSNLTFSRLPDVAGCEVRSRRECQYQLMHRTPDDDHKVDWPHVLVYVEDWANPERVVCWVRGWLYGRECRRKEWWKDPDGTGYAWWPDNTALHDIYTVPYVPASFDERQHEMEDRMKEREWEQRTGQKLPRITNTEDEDGQSTSRVQPRVESDREA